MSASTQKIWVFWKSKNPVLGRHKNPLEPMREEPEKVNRAKEIIRDLVRYYSEG